jgi:UDP-glucose 4-epimerase
MVLQVAAELRSQVQIYGDDYPTRDGTCVRLHHVVDLARAHNLALSNLEKRSAITTLAVAARAIRSEKSSNVRVLSLVQIFRCKLDHAARVTLRF